MGFFALLGTAVFLSYFLKLADFIWLYILRPSDEYKKYKQATRSYALITGATDGIGRSLAKDLYQKGFDLIIHGRDEKKLKATVQEIEALRVGGVVESFLADATGSDVDFAAIAKRFNHLNITLFINNVGGAYFETKRFEEWSESDHLEVIRWNALFSVFLTHAFLSSLRKTSLAHPVLVVFHGSLAAEFPSPHLSLYSTPKAFIQQLSANLSADEKFIAGESNIEFMYLHTGTAQSNATKASAGIPRPTSDEYAALIVKFLGCGRPEVVPHYAQRIGLATMRMLPGPILRQVLTVEANIEKFGNFLYTLTSG